MPCVKFKVLLFIYKRILIFAIDTASTGDPIDLIRRRQLEIQRNLSKNKGAGTAFGVLTLFAALIIFIIGKKKNR